MRPHSKDLPWNAAVCLPFLFTKVCLHWKCKHRMQLVFCFSLTPHIRHWVRNWQSCEHLKIGVQACGQPVTGAVFAPKRPLSHDGKALQPCIHKLPLVGFTGGRLFFCIVPWTHIHPQDLVSLQHSTKACIACIHQKASMRFSRFFGNFGANFKNPTAKS